MYTTHTLAEIHKIEATMGKVLKTFNDRTSSRRLSYIAIEGCIGIGKTTLAKHIGSIFSAQLLLEGVNQNPFLSNFYKKSSTR